MVIYLEQGADLHMAQLMPLPLTVSCFSKIQIGFHFLVLAHPGSPGKRAVKRVCVCKFSDRSPCDLACGSEYSSFYFVPSPHSSQCLLPSVTRNKDYYYTENFTMDLNKVCGKGLSNTN